MLATANTGKLGRGYGKNAGEWKQCGSLVGLCNESSSGEVMEKMQVNGSSVGLL